MGESFDARGSHCGEIFDISIGGGFRVMMLHGEVCGKPKARNIAEKIELRLHEGAMRVRARAVGTFPSSLPLGVPSAVQRNTKCPVTTSTATDLQSRTPCGRA